MMKYKLALASLLLGVLAFIPLWGVDKAVLALIFLAVLGFVGLMGWLVIVIFSEVFRRRRSRKSATVRSS